MGWVLSALLCLGSVPVLAATQHNPGRESAGAQKERDEVRKQLEAVKKAIEQTSTEKKRAAKALGVVEQKLKDTAARIAALDKERKALEAEIEDLNKQEAQLALDLANTQDRLARVLRNQYRRTEINPTQAWLAGQSASQAARDGYWYERISTAEKALAEQQAQQAEALEKLRQGLERKQDKLDDTIERQNKAQKDLAAQREERSQLIEDLNSKLSDQELQRKRLQRDEQRLTNTINQLARAIEEAKRREAERAARTTTLPDIKKGTPPKEREARSFSPPPMPSTGEFAKLKGRMVLPVQGTIVGRFGATRTKDGQGPSWKGLFIAAEPGQPVRVVGNGRVVFADFMRGFGEILVIDHGDEFLSVYGNNGKLLKKTGDTVNAGDVIAETGNSSGTLDNGLYFELRRQGIAFDPLSWTKGQ
ncbi:MAG TPA: peptidoglycan DD-metalloendopeptidase family protein [Limnobacter sp.]|uniref:murein hydrolase activator EnvC family protein n=1 Tax=Limnobacter sp. TaxID=2003368 RepID=UPI002EDADDB2